jgi:hypothetical protein
VWLTANDWTAGVIIKTRIVLRLLFTAQRYGTFAFLESHSNKIAPLVSCLVSKDGHPEKGAQAADGTATDGTASPCPPQQMVRRLQARQRAGRPTAPPGCPLGVREDAPVTTSVEEDVLMVLFKDGVRGAMRGTAESPCGSAHLSS